LGIIQKQSIKGSFISYIGILIGFVTGGILLPTLLSPEENGVLALLNTYSLLGATFATLGINAVSNRLFPYFRNPAKKHNGYLTIVLITSLIGFVISIIIFFTIKPVIIKDSLEDSALFVDYIYLIIPLIFFTLLFQILDIYYAVLYNAVKGLFIKEFLQRIFILAALLFVLFKVLEFDKFVLAWVIALSLPGIILLVNLIKDGEFVISLPPKSFISTSLRTSMLSVGFFGIIVAFSNILIMNIDRIMINSMLGLELTGIYDRAAYFGILIIIPSRAIINKISTVVIADAWKSEDISTIKQIYSTTSVNQLIFGLLVFIGIWANIDNVLKILPPSYEEGKYVIFFIGLANLFTMISGVSGPILSTSKYFKTLTLFILIFVALVISSNLILIKILGLMGAAIASAFSVMVYCLLRYVFLLIKYKLQPYSYKHLIIIIIGLGVYFLNVLIPDLGKTDSPDFMMIIDIFVRGSFIVLVFGFMILKTKVSQDINNNYSILAGKVKTLFKKS